MLLITVKAINKNGRWDPEEEKFIYLDHDITLQLEHSLISVSRWEAKWKKPYLSSSSKFEKTPEEVRDYIKCMTVSCNIDPDVYKLLSKENYEEINRYISDPMTATWFDNSKKDKGRGTEEMTSELMYYYMTEYGIPWEAQKWHLNRLLTLLRTFSEKESSSGNKISTRDLLKRNSSLNKMRRAALGSKG